MTYRRSFVLASAAAAALLSVSSVFAADKVNYQDHVLPIFRNNCLNCHNSDKKKAGLDLSTYSNTMAGSNNGQVINSGDPDGSLLYKAVTHAEEPTMPPKKDKLPDKELALIKQWISSGALETANGKPAVSSKPKVDLTVAVGAMKKPDGPLPMPRDLLPEPMRADRPWAVGCMATSPWAPVVAIGGQHQILIYDTNSLDLLGIVPFPDAEPQVVQFSKNGKVLLIGGGVSAKSGKVSLWDVTTGKKLTDVGDEFDSVLGADISPDQGSVALGGPTKVFKIYSTHDGSLQHVTKKHTDWITAVAYSPDGLMLASADRAGGMWIWESKGGNELYNLAGHKAGVTAVAFRDDSNFLASGSEDGTLKLWDLQSGKEAKSIQAHGGGVLSVAFTHDGRIVTCGRDNMVRTWSVDGAQIRQFDAFKDIALHATFDSEGKRVIAGDWTGELRVWDAADGKLLGKLSSNPAPLADRLVDAEKRIVESQQAADKATAAATLAQAQAADAAKAAKAAEVDAAAAKDAVAAVPAKRKAADDAVQQGKTAQTAADAAVVEKTAAVKQATKVRTAAAADRATAVDAQKDAQTALAAKQKAADAATAAADGAKADLKKKSDDAKLIAAAKKAQDAADAAAKELASAKSAAKAKTDALTALTESAAKAEAKFTEANTALDAAKKAAAAQVALMDKLRAARTEVEGLLPKAKAASVAADKQLAQMPAQVKAAVARAADAKAAADAAVQQVANVKLEIARLKVGQFFLNVYAAKQELTKAESGLDQLTASIKSAETEIQDDTAAIAAAKKALAEAPAHLKELETAAAKAREAVAPATAADQAAKADLAQKQALLTQANELSTKLWAETHKVPDNKQLAEAAAKAKSTSELLTAEVESATKLAADKAEALMTATANITAADAALAKHKTDLAGYPKQIETWQKEITVAQAEIPKRKAAAAEAAKAVGTVKAKVDQLSAEYQKKSQEAGLNAQANASGK